MRNVKELGWVEGKEWKEEGEGEKKREEMVKVCDGCDNDRDMRELVIRYCTKSPCQGLHNHWASRYLESASARTAALSIDYSLFIQTFLLFRDQVFFFNFFFFDFLFFYVAFF